MKSKLFPLSICSVLLATSAPTLAEEPLTGAAIVQGCSSKYAGETQRSLLSIALTDAAGKKVKYEFVRLWKTYKGKDGIDEKTILFTQYPPESKEVNFMRWSYTSGKQPDMWVYLPELHTVRRVSQRDPKNLDWGFIDEDMRPRALDEDEHRYVGIAAREAQEFYIVESTPKQRSLYGKRVTYFIKTDNWDDCAPARVDYHAPDGELVKRESVRWQKIKGAWVWKTAVMKNMKTLSSAVYDVRDVEVNADIPDAQFTERVLRRGLK